MPDTGGFDRSSRTRRNTRIVIGVVALAVVCLAGLGVLLLTNDLNATAGTAGPAAVSTAPSGPTAPSGQAHQVALALHRLTTDPGSLVASASPGPVNTTEGVPAGSTIDVDEASWSPDGHGGGTILATLTSPGLPSVSYAVVLVQENNAWKVLETLPITEPTR